METFQTRLPDPSLLPGKPLVGSVFELTRDRLAFPQHIAALGSVARFRMFNLELYHVSEPEAVQHILQDNARNYLKGPCSTPCAGWSATVYLFRTVISGCASAA